MAKRVKLDPEVFFYAGFFERIAKVRVKDSFEENGVVFFMLYPGSLRKALGKGGENIKRAQDKIGKRIRLVEFSTDVRKFVKNLIYPNKVEEIEVTEEGIIIREPSKKTKSLLIGRDARNLKLLNKVVDRYFSKEVKIK